MWWRCLPENQRPVTVELGTNALVGVDPDALREAAAEALAAGPPAEPPRIPHWDGEAGPRAAEAVVSFLASDDASFISGQAIVADGGMTAR